MTFPLHYRPGTVALLDDDPPYLEMLAMVMPAEWPVRLFLDPQACIHQLLDEISHWDADIARQQKIIDQFRTDGRPLIPQILAWWCEDSTHRFDLTQVLVVDYAMPAMTGLDVLNQLGAWPGHRILLTGQANESVAVSAFNEGLINQYIPKQSTEIASRTIEHIKQLQGKPGRGKDHIWRATLNAEQKELLATSAVKTLLGALITRQRWIEYVVIGAPFGLLGLDANGQAGWMQLEPKGKLLELAELALSQGMSGADVDDIRSGRKLADMELQQALGSGKPTRLSSATSMGDDPLLWAAIFPIDPAYCPGLGKSYSAYLKALGRSMPS